MKKKFLWKRLAQTAVVLGCLCVLLFAGYGYRMQRDDSPAAMRETAGVSSDTVGVKKKIGHTPPQDADGYYLLSTKEHFMWFISRDRDPHTNVRLVNDLILNDTEGWENWTDTPPENVYGSIPSYYGHFDGNGYALVGYYMAYGNWRSAVFMTLEEGAKVTDLTIRNSLFLTTYEDCAYENEDGHTDVVTSSALCFANCGEIVNCEVQAKVIGAWDAGGIVGINYGQMTDCRFTGTVEAGTDQSTEPPEYTYTKHSMFAGGICRSNQGRVQNCVNEGAVSLGVISDSFYVHDFAVGGISGQNAEGGSIEGCENRGAVTGAQLAGGIAGASRGRIYQCQNNGTVHIEQAERDYAETLVSAGVSASNGGKVDTCINTGSVTVNQKYLSFCAPVYGVACNTVNPGKGTIENSYYVKENVSQDYRQSGVNKLSIKDAAEFPAYLSGQKKREDRDGVCFAQAYIEEETDDVIHLGFGPKEDVTYVVEPGDSLWRIAKKFYGDGGRYSHLIEGNPKLQENVLLPGEEIIIPHKDYSVYRRRDEEGFGLSYCRLPSGEPCPTRFVTAKSIDWYYGSMQFDACAGLDVMWPKTYKDLGQFAFQADKIHVFCRVDANPEGDFFDGKWEEARASIEKSAALYCGEAAHCFAFKRYDMDNGENLYCYSFLLYKQRERLLCSVAYRLCDNMLVEFIGVEPLRAYAGSSVDDLSNREVMNRVPYLAAVADTNVKIEEAQYDPETFYGRENWEFPQLHNPFALALAYDRDAACSPYMLFTGAQ